MAHVGGQLRQQLFERPHAAAVATRLRRATRLCICTVVRCDRPAAAARARRCVPRVPEVRDRVRKRQARVRRHVRTSYPCGFGSVMLVLPLRQHPTSGGEIAAGSRAPARLLLPGGRVLRAGAFPRRERRVRPVHPPLLLRQRRHFPIDLQGGVTSIHLAKNTRKPDQRASSHRASDDCARRRYAAAAVVNPLR